MLWSTQAQRIIHSVLYLFNQFIPNYGLQKLNFSFVILLLGAVYGSSSCIVL
jgi:hypothetical protein